MNVVLRVLACIVVVAVLAGCANSVPRNAQATIAQATLAQGNFTVVQSGVKGTSEMSFLGCRMIGGEPFGIVLSGDKDLTTTAMDQLRRNAGLQGKARALVNVTEELQYDPWVIIYHHVTKTITADVVEFR